MPQAVRAVVPDLHGSRSPVQMEGVRGSVRQAPRMGGEAATRMNVNPPRPRRS